MFNVTISGASEVMARLGAMPQKMHDAILIKMVELEQLVIAKVRDNLSGVVLNAKSGALRDSIAGSISDTPNSITATVGSYGNEYAAIQEFGGKTAAHDILPVKGQALAFLMEGKLQFAKVIHHPGSNIPARSYLGSALDEMHEEIVRGLGEAIVEAAIL